MRIIYIDIDSCRADHLGCYGYSRSTSPNIDALARDGLRCDQYFASDAPCLPSRTAMYSGRLGIQTGVVGHGGTAAQPRIEGPGRGFIDAFGEQGLARQLQLLGLHTAMISPFGQRHSAHWFYAGMNEIHNTGMGGMESAEHVWPAIDQWLRNNVDSADGAARPRDNWYLHINFWDPHTPYRVPASYGEPFADAPLPRHLDDDELIARHVKKTGPHSATDLGMYVDADATRWPRSANRIASRAHMKHWIDGYDTGIHYADMYIGKIIDRLKAAGVYEDTVFIVSADHGENQGELGIYGEHATADVGTCRIPMIIKWPGMAKGVVDHGLRLNVDLAPTLMELLGGNSQRLWDGTSFAAAVRGQDSPGYEEVILSQCAHVCQRSVRFNVGIHQWLYMRTYHDGFHLFPREMLFDMTSDPYELSDIAPANPAVCREANWRLERWHATQMRNLAERSPHDIVDPLWRVISEGGPFHAVHTAVHESVYRQLPAYLKRLEATGRADGAAALRVKYGKWL